MKHYLTFLKDSLGSNYIGVNITNDAIQPHLEKLKEILGEEDYEIFTQNQQKRDRDEYHITVINVVEFNRLSQASGLGTFVKSIELLFSYEIDDLEMLGVGTASKNNSTTYFVVCKSDKLDAVRTRFNLPKQDFHITIGFNPKDVFGMPKNQVI